MRYALLFLLAVGVAPGQSGGGATAILAGSVSDAKTLKPVPGALVTAMRNGLPSFSRNTRSGATGLFRIEGLPAGNYVLCVQAQDAVWLNPCDWGTTPASIAVAIGQTVGSVA